MSDMFLDVPPTALVSRFPRVGFPGGKPHFHYRMTQRFPNVLLAVAMLMAAASCSRSAPPPAAGRGGTQREPAPVTVAVALETNFPVQVTGIGHAKAYSTVSIMSQVDGQLAKINFKEGEEIEQDQLIFEIDSSTYEANLNEAQAMLARDTALSAKADVDVRRSTELFNSKIESPDAHDQTLATAASLKATVQADEAAVQNAKLQLSYCSIRSPVTGRAGMLLVNAGNLIKKQDTALLVVNQIKPIYVDFSVLEKQLPNIRKYMADPTAAKLKVEAFVPEQNHHSFGQLQLINNTVDINTGNIFLRAIFPNEDEALWPGQFVNAALTLTEQRKVIIPAQSVQDSQNGQMVFVAREDSTVEERKIVTGARIGENIVVEKGLRDGEQVVTTGQLRLVNGAKYVLAKSASNNAARPMTSSTQ